MKFKEGPRAPDPEPVERDDVHVATNRCPYCHDNIVQGEVRLGCPHCMAWSHKACWEEGDAQCSSCGGAFQNLGSLQAACATAGCDEPLATLLGQSWTRCRIHEGAARLATVLKILAAAIALCLTIALTLDFAGTGRVWTEKDSFWTWIWLTIPLSILLVSMQLKRTSEGPDP